MAPRSAPAQRNRTAVYTRISKDVDGKQDATERQLVDCRKYADLHGLEIAEVFEDVDTSAYRKGVIRPQYEELLAAMRDGEFDVVLVWRIDRLVRRTVDFAAFWQIADDNGIALRAAMQSIDTSDAVGKMIVDILVSFAEMESATISARILSKEKALAERGIHKGAGRRAYGLEKGWKKTVPEEVNIIREIADRLLADEPVGSIARDLNNRGVPSASGGRWSRIGISTLMRQPRLWGWRERHGELVARGTWPTILDEAEGRRLRKMIDDRARFRGGPTTPRKYLLSGLLRCGKCGHAMKAARGNREKRTYTCYTKVDGGCSGTSIIGKAADEIVTEMALYRLDSPEFATIIEARATKRQGDGDADLLLELAAANDQADELAEQFADGEMSAAAYARATRTLEARIDKMNERLVDVDQVSPLRGIIEGDGGLREVWERMTVERQRAVLDVLLERVVVHNNGSPYYVKRLRAALLDEAKEDDEACLELRRARDILKSAAVDDVSLTAEEIAFVRNDPTIPDEVKQFAGRLRVGRVRKARDELDDVIGQLTKQADWHRARASRRRRQAKTRVGGGGADGLRPERLEPIWRI